MDHEGTVVARWLKAHGIATFLLKYRLVPTATAEAEFWGQVTAFLRDRETSGDVMQQAQARAVADGLQAVSLVRQQAADWGLAPDRIGILGFSAGAMVALGVATQYEPASRPDFAAPIYGTGVDAAAIPGDAPPLFIVAAGDDPLLPAEGSARLYTAWKTAGHPAELHLYAQGGHGFGMKKQGPPVDTWIDRLGEWLRMQGLLEPTP